MKKGSLFLISWILLNISLISISIAYNTNSFDELSTLKDDIQLFDLKGQTFDAKVVDVYDGDTCTIVIKLHNQWTKFKVRSYGYDTPEMRPPKTLHNRDKIIDMAIKARNYFVSRVTDVNIDLSKHYTKKELKDIINNNRKVISVRSRGWDKYGRLLGDFYVDNVYLNEEMVHKKYGYEYDGGTKETFEISSYH